MVFFVAETTVHDDRGGDESSFKEGNNFFLNKRLFPQGSFTALWSKQKTFYWLGALAREKPVQSQCSIHASLYKKRALIDWESLREQICPITVLHGSWKENTFVMSESDSEWSITYDNFNFFVKTTEQEKKIAKNLQLLQEYSLCFGKWFSRKCKNEHFLFNTLLPASLFHRS